MRLKTPEPTPVPRCLFLGRIRFGGDMPLGNRGLHFA